MRRGLRVVIALSGLTWLTVGCAAPSMRERATQRVIEDATPEVVLAAAAPLLQREFGRVARSEDGRTLTTAPIEFTTVRNSGTARDLYGGRTTMRRTAMFRVSPNERGTVAQLKIDIERRDTERRQVMPIRGTRLSDTPGSQTAIDDDAATTAEQNTVWTWVRRDLKLERALLEELREQLAPAVPENRPAAAPTPESPAQE